MKKSFFALFLVLLMCASASAVYAATKTSADFSDLKDLDAATKAKFDALISAGVFDGLDDGKFGLDENMNRAQFAKVAALIFNLDVDTSVKTSSFSDVKADDPANGYALPYIEAARKAGITDGMAPGIFNPAGEVTKEQLATFLVRGLGWEKDAQATPGVIDSTVSDWAKGYVALALDKKLLSNGTDGDFGGTSAANRSLLVTASYQADQQYVEIQKKKEEEEKKKLLEQLLSSYTPPVQATVYNPTANPAGGAVTSGTEVVLTSATESATVYYTTDLSEPTTSSTLYTEPIIITSDTTIKAIAVKSGSINSSVVSFVYTVQASSKSPLDLINEASESGSWDNVDITTFVSAGVTGVTLENLPNIQIVLNYDETPYPRTLEQIQAIVDETISADMLSAIHDWLRGYGGFVEEPTVDVFTKAGITGVNELNIADILPILQASFSDPFGMVMPSKEEIQEVIDSYLESHGDL